MFKPKEELKQKASKGRNLSEAKYQFNCGINAAFNTFAERITFYETYEEDSGLLQTERPDDYKEFLKYRSGRMHEVGLEVWNREYRVWLFIYCFGGVKLDD